jgi:hypothetical protein
LSVLFLVVVGAAITGAIPVVKIEPTAQEVTAGDQFTITVTIENVTNLGANQATVSFEPHAMSAVAVTEGALLKGAGTTIGAGMELVDNSNGSVTFFYALTAYGANVSGSGALAAIEFATNDSYEGRFGLNLSNVLLSNGTGSMILPIALANGSVTLVPPTGVSFDTGPGTYPSIAGMFNGTITPTVPIMVAALRTYPCPGTGGHAEYARIWNTSGTIAEAYWNGYAGEWENITFNETFTLYANETYNCTIRTGSYPQLIHAERKEVTGGTITCSEFVDVNGAKHYAWIPAVRFA